MEIQRYNCNGAEAMSEENNGTYVKYEDFEESQRVLKQCFADVVWMAIRYAHGRSTCAPGMVRDAINDFKMIFPNWEVAQDITIEPPGKLGFGLRIDYLDDLIPK